MIWGDKTMRKVINPFDCRPFGRAVKEARIKSGLTRAEVEERYNIDARYLLEIENKGQHMSLQIFYELATIFSISVDQFFFPEVEPAKNSQRKQLDSLLDTFDSREMAIVEATVQGIHNSRGMGDD